MTDKRADCGAFRPAETAAAAGYAGFVIDRPVVRAGGGAQREVVRGREPAAGLKERRRTGHPPRRPSVAGSSDAERELLLAAEPSELSRARAFADAAAEASGFGDEDRFAVTLAVSEAVANAIEHGGGKPDACVRITATERNGALAVQVEDSGSFDADAPGADELPERGRGLALIAELVDELFVCPGPGGTVLRLCKQRAG